MSFPSSLDFSKLTPNAVKTRIRQVAITALQGSTINPGDNPIFNIPCGVYGQYLDPSQTFLQFTFNNTDTTAAQTLNLDGSFYSLMDRITVTSSGAVISDFQQFGGWAQVMLDSYVATGKNSMAIFAGTASDANRNWTRDGIQVAQKAGIFGALPLMGSGILDPTGNQKMVPVGALQDLELQIFMASVGNSVFSASTTVNWQLTNVQLVIGIVELDPGAQKMIDEMCGGQYKLSVELWRGYNTTLSASTTGDQVIIPHKCQSAKTILWIYRLQGNFSNPKAYTQVSRFNPYYHDGTTPCSVFVQAGATAYPQVPIKNWASLFLEYEKAFHALGVPEALRNSFDASTWIAGDNTSVNSAGSFVGGINLEAYSGKSGVINSGAEVTGGTTMILNSSYAQALPNVPVTQSTYVHFDAIAVVSNGVMEIAF
jgi:hypothetical protein